MMKFDSIGMAFCNGVEDRHTHGLLRNEQLYRGGPMQRCAWRVGWEIANLLTARNLRTTHATPPKEKP